MTSSRLPAKPIKADEAFFNSIKIDLIHFNNLPLPC